MQKKCILQTPKEFFYEWKYQQLVSKQFLQWYRPNVAAQLTVYVKPKMQIMYYKLCKHCVFFSIFIKLRFCEGSYSCFYFSSPNILLVCYNSFCNTWLHSSTIYYFLISIKVDGLLFLITKNGMVKTIFLKKYWCAFPMVSSMFQEQLGKQNSSRIKMVWCVILPH